MNDTHYLTNEQPNELPQKNIENFFTEVTLKIRKQPTLWHVAYNVWSASVIEKEERERDREREMKLHGIATLFKTSKRTYFKGKILVT